MHNSLIASIHFTGYLPFGTIFPFTWKGMPAAKSVLIVVAKSCTVAFKAACWTAFRLAIWLPGTFSRIKSVHFLGMVYLPFLNFPKIFSTSKPRMSLFLWYIPLSCEYVFIQGSLPESATSAHSIHPKFRGQ
jgi:hypothetical protein